MHALAVVLRTDRLAFAVTVAVAAVLYSTLLTDVVFTNHLIPNAFINPYPSFKTWHEGRWLADIIIWMFGGGGTQSFQAIAGILIQAVNGLLFASILGVSTAARRTIVAVLVSMHPALLDYYSFAVDNITFTLGDTLALVAIWMLSRGTHRWQGIATAVLLFVLAIASYQPKISVIGTALLCAVLVRLADEDTSPAEVVRRAIVLACSALAGLLLYGATTLAIVRFNGAGRNHVNGLSDILAAIVHSYGSVASTIGRQVTTMPTFTGWALAALVIIGLGGGLLGAARKGWIAAGLYVLCLLLLPPAIEATFVVNNQTQAGIGRALMGHAYLVPALFALIPFRRYWLDVVLGAGTAFGFCLVAMQENQATAMKSLFDIQMMSRIVGRIELALPDRDVHPLVVLGSSAFEAAGRLQLQPDRPFRPHLSTVAFIQYRQVEMANFFLGRRLLKHPTQADVDAAIVAAAQVTPWPASEAVFVANDVVVVALEAPGPHTTVTGAIN